jgi:hypothetical protein
MGVLLKYTIESVLIAGSAAALTRGQMSFKRFLVLSVLSFLVFVLLDTFAPIKEVRAELGSGQLGGANEKDMCGGGLVQALQDINLTGGATEQVDPYLGMRFKDHPYKLQSTMYGTALFAGFNEHVTGF